MSTHRAARLAGVTLSAGAIFLGTGLALLALASQFAPGFHASGPEPAIEPDPLRDTRSPAVAAVEQGQVTVTAGDIRLNGWIVRPAGDASRVPGVVLVPGAGPSDREALLDEAVVLASAGIAAIVYDKRPEGYSFFSRDYARLADDAIAAADVLAAEDAVDPDRIGIMGWSEGGWVAPTAVERAPHRFAFLALASAPIVSPLEQVAWAVDRPISGAPDWIRRIPATALAAGRPLVDYLDFNVGQALDSVRVPVYAVWGADDWSMPVAAAERLLVERLHFEPTVRLLPGVGHELPVDTGWLGDAALWISSVPNEPPATVQGVEPSSSLGVSTLPTPTWFTSPVVHVAVAALVAAASVILPGATRRVTAARVKG